MPLPASPLTDRPRLPSIAILGLPVRRRPMTFTYGPTRSAAGTHTWTVTSQGNAVKVYGLWITTSATPLCSTSNGQPWLSISPASVSGLEASINGGVIAPQGTSLTGIDWNWGDGTVLIGCVYFPESHTYHQTGEYTVVVTTTFTNGTKLQASENVTVVSANSSGANLNGTDLSGANLTDANLSGANLNKADLSGANLTDANPERCESQQSGSVGRQSHGREPERCESQQSWRMSRVP